MSENLTESVGTAVAGFDGSTLPPEVRAKVEELIRDSVACAVGAHSSETMELLEQIIDPSGGPCLILHSGKQAKLLEAVLLNSQAANMLDFDDAHTDLGHPGATIVQPALALAQARGKTHDEVVEAVAAGYEFNLRWARAVFDYEGKFAGPWSVALLQSYGAYITAAKLLGLDAQQVARGLYFAAAGMPLPVAMKTGIMPGQKMNGLKNYYGQVAHSMVLAALAANADIYSDTTVLDGDQGLWHMMGAKEFHADRVLENLGSEWLIMEMQLKPYSACRWNHAAIDAFGFLAPQFDRAAVERVDVCTFVACVNACSTPEPSNTFEVSFSLPHCFGMMMEGHSLMLLSEDSVHDRAVVEFSHRVHLHEDARMETLFDDGKLPARVVVTLTGGETIEQEVLTMKGEAENPMSDEEHAMKIQALIASSPFDHVRSYAGSIVEA